MNLRFVKVTMATICISALSACSINQQVSNEELKIPNSNALDELVNISVEARDELRLLAKSQESIAQKAMTKEQHEQRFLQATQVPEGFEIKGDFAYSGPATSAAKALAAAVGYKFVILGSEKADQPWVYIKIKDLPLNEALKELGLQTGKRVRIELHSKVMTYKNLN